MGIVVQPPGRAAQIPEQPAIDDFRQARREKPPTPSRGTRSRGGNRRTSPEPRNRLDGALSGFPVRIKRNSASISRRI